MSVFGWDYPAGCTGTPYDEDEYCVVCCKTDCDCQECPGCGVAGDQDCYGIAGHMPDAVLLIRSLVELAREVESQIDTGTGDEIERSIARRLYKATTCGISFGRKTSEPDGIEVCGYCEGCDWEIEPHVLEYPFTREEFWAAVDQADEDGCDIWDQTHGCEDCGPEDFETGATAINPDCKSCGGSGVIL